MQKNNVEKNNLKMLADELFVAEVSTLKGGLVAQIAQSGGGSARTSTERGGTPIRAGSLAVVNPAFVLKVK